MGHSVGSERVSIEVTDVAGVVVGHYGLDGDLVVGESFDGSLSERGCCDGFLVF